MATTIQQVSTEENPTRRAANSRLLGLDVLRLAAVVLVLGRHMWPPPEDWPRVPRLALLLWERGGWVGVDLFFVLSGFLVSGLLFGEYKSHGRFSIGRFYVRRGWKIYPPFIALIVTTVAVLLALGKEVEGSSVASELLFLQSYAPGLWGHTWSLAVEEHFYLLLPMVLALILRLRINSAEPLRPVLALAVCVAVLCLTLRVLNWHFRPGYTLITHLFASHLRLDSLFFGVAISYVYRFHTGWFVESFSRWRACLIAGGILMLSPAFLFPIETTPMVYTVGLTGFYLGSGAILVGILLCRTPTSPLLVAAATLGAYSYSIYLWHMPVQHWGVRMIERSVGSPLGFEVKAAIYLLGSMAVGVGMAKIIEMPALRIRDAWFPSRAARPTLQTLPADGAAMTAKE